jgi:hypothetical protein
MKYYYFQGTDGMGNQIQALYTWTPAFPGKVVAMVFEQGEVTTSNIPAKILDWTPGEDVYEVTDEHVLMTLSKEEFMRINNNPQKFLR